LELSGLEKALVEVLQPNKLTGPSKNSDYVSLRGFGAEIAHLTDEKIYRDKSHFGLCEALDFASQILELSKDIKFLYGLGKKQAVPETTIIENMVLKYIEFKIKQNDIYEDMLFEGDSFAKLKIMQYFEMDEKNASSLLKEFKRDYVETTHYDGMKLFLEILYSIRLDLPEAYKKLGNVLNNPLITDMETALEELGCTYKELSKYKGTFEESEDMRDLYLSLKSKLMHCEDWDYDDWEE